MNSWSEVESYRTCACRCNPPVLCRRQAWLAWEFTGWPFIWRLNNWTRGCKCQAGIRRCIIRTSRQYTRMTMVESLYKRPFVWWEKFNETSQSSVCLYVSLKQQKENTKLQITDHYEMNLPIASPLHFYQKTHSFNNHFVAFLLKVSVNMATLCTFPQRRSANGL